jgi:hypothetical protein
MTVMLKHIGLVSESDAVPVAALMGVAAALQKQATRDLAPIWDVAATVDAFDSVATMPVDYWPIIIRDNIGYDAAGIHLDDNNQPFALVSASDRRDIWSLTASHEMCEMLVDPFGNRLIAGGPIKPGQGRVNYLVEVCDPSEDAHFAYTVNGVLVSDFYTPHFFDPTASGGVRYSFTGAITAPRMIREGGYLTWVDPATGIWWQQTWFDGGGPRFRSLGKMSAKKSLRAQVDRKTAQFTAAAIGSDGAAAVRAASPANAVDPAAQNRAKGLRDLIAGLTGVA